MTLVGMASGPATDGLALVAEGAVSGWLCRLRATLGFMEEQESEAARSLLVPSGRVPDAGGDARCPKRCGGLKGFHGERPACRVDVYVADPDT